MGCCFSSEDDKDAAFGEPTENTNLISNHGPGGEPSPGIGPRYTEELPGKRDEQSAMARILSENAKEVIDVASNETPLEQAEYHDRARQYNRMLNVPSTRLKLILAGFSSRGPKLVFPSGITAPQSVLAAPPISPAEIQLITTLAERNCRAMRDVHIQHREDLVVSFGVPVP